jgi:hypothetical protein
MRDASSRGLNTEQTRTRTTYSLVCPPSGHPFRVQSVFRPWPHCWSIRLDNLGQESASVEQVPHKTYNFTLPGPIANASRHTGYRLVEHRKFRTGCRGVRLAKGLGIGDWG